MWKFIPTFVWRSIFSSLGIHLEVGLLRRGNSVAAVVQSLSRVWLFVTHELQHARLPCPSLSPWVCSNSCPLSQWCHPTISFSVTPFSSCPRFFPESGSFIVSRLFTSSGQSIWASLLPMNIQGWLPLGLTGLISTRSKGLSRVFYSTTIWKHRFFSTEPLDGPTHIRTWLLENP